MPLVTSLARLMPSHSAPRRGRRISRPAAAPGRRQEDEGALVGSRRPRARAAHSLVAGKGGEVLVFGGVTADEGGGGTRHLGDVAAVDVSKWRSFCVGMVRRCVAAAARPAVYLCHPTDRDGGGGRDAHA